MSTITADQPKTKLLSLSHTHYFVFRKREEEDDGREGGREGKREGGTYHLRDLSKGDEPCGEPVRDFFDDRQPVVGVHGGVHGVVHGDEDDAGVFVGVSEPGKEKNRHVVVPILFMG